jgi:hypothetical protein
LCPSGIFKCAIDRRGAMFAQQYWGRKKSIAPFYYYNFVCQLLEYATSYNLLLNNIKRQAEKLSRFSG